MADSVLTDLNNSDNLTNILIDMEDWMDNLNLYSFENWIDGEIVSGPNVTKYWTSIDLMFPYEKMPDPKGALILGKHGARVGYKKDHIEDTLPKEPLDMTQFVYNSYWVDGLLHHRKEPTIDTREVWLVRIEIPRKFIDVNIDNDEYFINPDSATYIDDSEDYSDISESILREGLKIGDLENTVLPVITMDEYESKFGNDYIVFGFFVTEIDVANDLNSFVQKSFVDIMDSDVAPIPTPDGHYIVFVEIERNENGLNGIVDLVHSMSGITGISKNSWYFSSINHGNEKLSIENIQRFLVDDNEEID